MRRIISRLKNEFNVPISKCHAVDFFAREGALQTVVFAHEVAHICAWEIEQHYLPALKANLPQEAEITIGDSYEIALRRENLYRFDFLVLDNPQGIFGDGKCEHFEVLPLVPTLAMEYSVLVFNVNIEPFNYEQHPLWAARRELYYGRNAAQLPIDFILEFYKDKLFDLGVKVNAIFAENRSPGAYQRRTNIFHAVSNHDWRNRIKSFCQMKDLPLPNTLHQDLNQLEELASLFK